MSARSTDYREAVDHLPEGATLVLQDVPWEDYEQLLEDLADRPRVRVSYDQGRLEIMSPLRKHEKYRTNLAGFAKLWSKIEDLRVKITETLVDFDVFLSPVAAFPAIPHGTSTRDDVFPGFSYTMTWNLMGWPAAVVRCGTSKEGLPIGVQIASGPQRDDVVLAVARFLERKFGGWVMPSVGAT